MIEKIQARIRDDDDIIREHFLSVKKSDHPYEVRRLLEKAILMERKEKQILEGIEIQTGQGS